LAATLWPYYTDGDIVGRWNSFSNALHRPRSGGKTDLGHWTTGILTSLTLTMFTHCQSFEILHVLRKVQTDQSRTKGQAGHGRELEPLNGSKHYSKHRQTVLVSMTKELPLALAPGSAPLARGEMQLEGPIKGCDSGEYMNVPAGWVNARDVL
jgi:hypothetical protein